MLFNLDFANKTILSCLFFSFFIIDLQFLIAAVIPQLFNPIAELVIPVEIPGKEAKAEIEMHLLIVKAKIRKFSNLFVLLTHLFILLYLFKEILSCFIYTS